jgi:hypothetical protein
MTYSKFANGVEKRFGLIATFIGFIVDTITLTALINSRVAPVIPFIDKPIDATGKFLVWTVALVTYLGFLREYWLGLSRRLSTRPSDTFSRFLFYDVILGFKQTFALIPVLFLVYYLVSIIVTYIDPLTMFVILFFLAVIIFGIIAAIVSEKAQKKNDELEWQAIYSNENFDIWKDRIGRLLNEKRFVTDYELSTIYSESISLCQKALSRFEQEFETRLDLALITEAIPTKDQRGYTSYYYLFVLTLRKMIDSRPWLENYSSS